MQHTCRHCGRLGHQCKVWLRAARIGFLRFQRQNPGPFAAIIRPLHFPRHHGRTYLQNQIQAQPWDRKDQ